VKLAFFGTPLFAVPSLDALAAAGHEIALVVTNPDRPQGRSRTPVAPPVKERALALGLPVHQPAAVKGDARLESLAREGIELGVVVAFGQFLPKPVRESPSLGYMINLHASLLPRWRGAAPIPAAIRAGDAVTGVSVQKVEKALDGGAVLASREHPLRGDETRRSLEDELSREGALLLATCVARIASGEAVFSLQDESGATHVGKIETADARLDLARPAAELERLVRAMDPDPIAWIELAPGQKLQVLRARPVALKTPRPAGEVDALSADDLVVATGDGGLALARVRPAGKQEMSGAAWARGKRLSPGSPLK
jgi:methionyl-tRNA formyltransferase